jgi:cell division protein FtsQ
VSGSGVALPRRRNRSTQRARPNRRRKPARTRTVARRRRRVVLALLLIAVFSALYWFWFRDSSLVAVKTVKIDGIGTRPADRKLNAALTDAAEQMTTLHVQPELLDAAASKFPLVQSVSADPGFPSTLTLHVTERRPASLIDTGDHLIAVSADGVVLRGLPADHLKLPRLPISEPPHKGRLGGAVLQQAKVLGAMPKAFEPLIAHSLDEDSGVAVRLLGGVELRFGTAASAAEKWRAAATVLSDPGLGALDYVDLRVPTRPAVGGVGHSPPSLSSP